VKKIVVTGGCGFIGSWCCEFYAKKGWKVVAYDNLTKHELGRTGYDIEKARRYNVDFIASKNVELVKADIRNKDEFFEYVHDADFIIHTAAQPAMTISTEDIDLDFTTNVVGTLNVLEAAKKFDVPVVNCATIHVYGNTINDELDETETRFTRDPVAIAEDYPIVRGTLTPLHASKAAADIYAKVYADTYKVKVASFRLTGLYGERQFGGEDHGWVANFSIRALLDLPITIYGSGKQLRDILYAEDLIKAFNAFYEAPVSGIYNIGGGEDNMISLLECTKVIENILGKRLKINFKDERLGDLKYFVCDNAKAAKILGWKPKILPKQGIENLINWIAKNENIFKV
jgi:CDP-paratose 2-epimerase